MAHGEADPAKLQCPFCDFDDYDSDILLQHLHLCHPEDPSTAACDVTQDDANPASHQATNEFVPCPHGCGEAVSRADLPLHLDLHLAESLALHDSGDHDTGKPHDDYAEDPLYNRLITFNNGSSDLPSNEKGQAEAVPSTGKHVMKFIRKRKYSKTTDSNGETKRLGVCIPTSFNLFKRKLYLS